MSKIILITGGARSGKSAFAERIAARTAQGVMRSAPGQTHISQTEAHPSGQLDAVPAEAPAQTSQNRPIYIATADRAGLRDDAEMAARIAQHQQRRGDTWRTVEAPYDLSQALNQTDGAEVRLVDCLTVWLSNLMLAAHDAQTPHDPAPSWTAECRALITTLEAQTSPVILVTNEVGAGIIPENALARSFRDHAGYLNQWVAEVADEVYLVTAGLPLQLKPSRLSVEHTQR